MNAKLLPYILILPVTLFLCVFFLYPFVLVGQQAFYSEGGFSLDSFREVVGYWKFPITLKNTMLLAAVVVPVQLARVVDGDDGEQNGKRARLGALCLDDPPRDFRPCGRPDLACDL